MRTPFQLPSNCAPVSFNISIVPSGFPVCSIPPFTEPDLCMTAVNISVPFVVPAEVCFTVPPFGTGVSASPKRDIDHLHVSARISPNLNSYSLADACDPSYNLSLLISLPCLPVSVDSTASITMSYQATPSLHVDLSRLSGCTLRAGVDIVIPCIAFEPIFSVYIYPIDCGLAPVAIPSVIINECEVQFKLDLFLPSCGAGVCPAFTYVGYISGYPGYLQIHYWKQSTNCSHNYHHFSRQNVA